MIPQAPPRAVEDFLGSNEQRAFTIEANGKAFRTLIDGLYSDKELAVIRELWSNALDSHIAAGTPKLPFHVDMPTPLSPVFRVRDFGVSLDHEDILGLYTTIFKSTKEETNDQVGSFGLGSKSPFAYTDSFSVIAYKDGVKRAYVAHIGTDGLPLISYLGSVESDDPTGLEISFAVKPSDFSTFRDRARVVASGFKVVPTGVDYHRPEPFYSGDNWELHTGRSYSGAKVQIRQGCVIYPLTDHTLARPIDSKVNYEVYLIIDVPIGTTDVTASRDTLSLTESSRIKISEEIVKVAASLDLVIEAELAGQANRLEAAHAKERLGKVFSNHRGNASVSLTPDKGSTDVPGGAVFRAKGNGRRNSGQASGQRVTRFNMAEIPGMRIVVDDRRPVKRRQLRITAHLSSNAYILYDDGSGKAVERVMRLLGLRRSQVCWLHELPDVDVPTKRPAAKKNIVKGAPWALRHVKTVELPAINQMDSFGELAAHTRALADKLGVSLSGLEYFTAKQAERLGLDPALRIDNLIVAAVDKLASSLPVYEIAVHKAIRNHYLGNEVKAHILTNYFTGVSVTNPEPNYFDRIVGLGSALPALWASMQVKANTEMSELVERFPLVFGRDNTDALIEYMSSLDAAKSNTAHAVGGN